MPAEGKSKSKILRDQKKIRSTPAVAFFAHSFTDFLFPLWSLDVPSNSFLIPSRSVIKENFPFPARIIKDPSCRTCFWKYYNVVSPNHADHGVSGGGSKKQPTSIKRELWVLAPADPSVLLHTPTYSPLAEKRKKKKKREGEKKHERRGYRTSGRQAQNDNNNDMIKNPPSWGAIRQNQSDGHLL